MKKEEIEKSDALGTGCVIIRSRRGSVLASCHSPPPLCVEGHGPQTIHGQYAPPPPPASSLEASGTWWWDVGEGA